MAVCAGFMAIGVAGLALVLRLVLGKANRRNGFYDSKDVDEYEMQHGRKNDDSHTQEVEETLIGGHRKVNGFRYML
jgi:hypothetical protein